MEGALENLKEWVPKVQGRKAESLRQKDRAGIVMALMSAAYLFSRAADQSAAFFIVMQQDFIVPADNL